MTVRPDPTRRPAPDEAVAYFQQYVALVPEGDVLMHLGEQADAVAAFARGLSPDLRGHRYAPGKWSLAQVLGHLIDCERVFAYRTLCFARGEQEPQPGFEHDRWAEATDGDGRSLAVLGTEFERARRATVDLFTGLRAGDWDRRGVANDNPMSVRALAWVLVGHVRHHLDVVHERYLGDTADGGA